MKRTRKNNNKGRKKTKTVRCSPKLDKKDYTCYTDKSLHKLKKYWNIRHPDSKIKSNTSKEIWSQLKKYMGNICGNEECWLRQKFIYNNLDKELLTYTFAPKAPYEWKKNPNEWLTSVDLENVMKQYEKTYPCFEFIGPSPIDYDTHKLYGECVWEELCHFNLKQMQKRGKNKIGIIFNTDPHYLEGSHWISMFINLKEKYIYFFDSNGDKPPRQIKKLVKNITKQAKEQGIQLKYFENEREHQQSDTECGMYSLYLIIQLLTDTKNPEYFKNHTITDKDMEQLRRVYFNESA